MTKEAVGMKEPGCHGDTLFGSLRDEGATGTLCLGVTETGELWERFIWFRALWDVLPGLSPRGETKERKPGNPFSFSRMRYPECFSGKLMIAIDTINISNTINTKIQGSETTC